MKKRRQSQKTSRPSKTEVPQEDKVENTSKKTSLKTKVAKSLSWRFHASAATLGVSYWYTGTLELAGILVGTLIVFKLCLYIYHEALWERIVD